VKSARSSIALMTLMALYVLDAFYGPARAQDPKTDLGRLTGTWRIVKGRHRGQDLPADYCALVRWTFSSGGKLAISVADEGLGCKFKLPGQSKIDLFLGGDRPCQGIYRFDGENQITICAFDFPSSQRPTEFISHERSGTSLLFLTRAPAGEEKPSSQDLAKFKDSINKVREAVAHNFMRNNLAALAIACLNYESVHRTYPPAVLLSKDGKPLLSWRVLVLPFLGEEKLFSQFKLTEPWDSPHNSKLLPKMPAVFAPMSIAGTDAHSTPWQVFTGPGSIFEGPKGCPLTEVTDGTSLTMLIAESNRLVPWTKPEDLSFDAKKDIPKLGSMFQDIFLFALADGSVHFGRRDFDAAAMRAAITRAAGDLVDFDKIHAKDVR